ncbi:MAG: DNA primase [Actinomycetota bacterium]
MDVVEEIKLRIDLVELVSAYVPLKQAGRTHKGLCPFHSEKTPSFTVDRERGFFKCWGCGVGGDCFKFIQLREGLSFPEAGELLARKAGLEWVTRGQTPEQRSERERLHDVVALAERFYRQRFAENRDVQKYVTQRGISAETVEQFGIGYAPGGYEALLSWLKREKVSLEDAERADVILQGEHGWRDRFVDRLIFPIYDLDGRPIAFGGRTLQPDGIPKYLNSRETPIFQKGRTFYGLHLAKRAIPRSEFVVAVEGYMDLIALHQAGIDNSVASLGTAITDVGVGILRRYSNQLVMCYDGDGAGMRAALRNSAMFEAAGCEVRVARVPEGDDPDTYIKKNGSDAFRALLNRAEPLLDYQLEELRKRYNLTDESARLPFVREAVRIITQSGSNLVRQEYAAKLSRVLDRLSQEWYPGDPHRAMQARVALTNEINQVVRTDRVNGRAVDPKGSPPPPARRALKSGRVGAQRYVLRAALTEFRWAEWVAEYAAPEFFPDAELAGIAHRLLGNKDDGGSATPAERAEKIRLDPNLAEVLSPLLLDESPLTDEGLELCLQKLEREYKQDRKTELRRGIAAGEIAVDDPRWEEYQRLSAELDGLRREA